MTHYFLDSSALVKRYAAEQGTGWIRAISLPSAGNTILVASVTQIEVFSGVSRRKREGTISARSAQTIRLLLTRHVRREYLVIELTTEILKRAEDMLDKYPLRAYDSIQLASALVANARLTAKGLTPLLFLSADTRLLAATNAEGMAFDDPNQHP